MSSSSVTYWRQNLSRGIKSAGVLLLAKYTEWRRSLEAPAHVVPIDRPPYTAQEEEVDGTKTRLVSIWCPFSASRTGLVSPSDLLAGLPSHISCWHTSVTRPHLPSPHSMLTIGWTLDSGRKDTNKVQLLQLMLSTTPSSSPSPHNR